METQEKLITLFEYLKQFNNLKLNRIINVVNEAWYKYFNDIPHADEGFISYPMLDSNSDDSNVLLSVTKPEFDPPPKPSPLFLDWLMDGWDDYTKDVLPRNSLEKGDYTTAKHDNEDELNFGIEHFYDVKERASAYSIWKIKRDIWREKQFKIKTVRDFFEELYTERMTINNAPDSYVLSVGNGIFKDAKNHDIEYPLLIKDVHIDFYPVSNKIVIVNGDDSSWLNVSLLSNIEGDNLDYGAITGYKSILDENDYHPLDKEKTKDFLKGLLNSFSSKGKFVDNDGKSASFGRNRFIVVWKPVLFLRKKSNDASQAIESIISDLNGKGKFPNALGEIVDGGKREESVSEDETSIESDLAAVNGENPEILLSMPSNREQLDVANRIEKYPAVVVQGPPGTGKTHTIANLIGHFLSEGKTVLVTSYTQKALTVLKDKVPAPLQDLCVSLMTGNYAELAHSIDGIISKMANSSPDSQRRKALDIKVSRQKVIDELNSVRRKIYQIRHKEVETIVFNGEGYSPIEAAKFVHDNQSRLDYIPGRVKVNAALPLSCDEFDFLYQSNETLSSADENELSLSMPNLDSVLSPTDFENVVTNLSDAKQKVESLANEINAGIEWNMSDASITLKIAAKSMMNPSREFNTIDIKSVNKKSMDYLGQLIESLSTLNEWMIYAASDGASGNGYRDNWNKLIDLIKAAHEKSNCLISRSFDKEMKISNNIAIDDIKIAIAKRLDELKSPSGISFLDKFFNRRIISTLEDNITINGRPISASNINDIELAKEELDLFDMRATCSRYWNKLLANHGLPVFDELNEQQPEHIAAQMIPMIERALDWQENEYTPIAKAAAQVGINVDDICNIDVLDNQYVKIKKIISTIRTLLPTLVKINDAVFDYYNYRQQLNRAVQSISGGQQSKAEICHDLVVAVKQANVGNYITTYKQYAGMLKKQEVFKKRIRLLDKLKEAAPEWANQIALRNGKYGVSVAPNDIVSIWKWAQLRAALDDIAVTPLNELQEKNEELSLEYRKETAELAKCMAWYHLLNRTSDDISLQQDLQGWKLTMKKIGKGTGKWASKRRKEARVLMARCQKAVPVWIMPINRVLESLVPGKNIFDVVIVDEASQADITALTVMYIGKKTIIVGDDKQVSPLSVGLDETKIENLKDAHIKGIIPNDNLYTAKTSLYDIAQTTFKPLMLKEHFRCMPDIIGFSNYFIYENQIKPLRDEKSSILCPAVVPYRVQGKRDGRKKQNLVEAESIVALISVCADMPEYADKTFGVISMLGDDAGDQAKLIMSILMKRMKQSDIEKHNILCGNAANFQGDERDVIFLSLVDSATGKGPMRLVSDGADGTTKKRYNVATSRAKDQLWIVHSFDPSTDVKPDDIRKKLLDYASNPSAYADSLIELNKKAESPFEKEVGEKLAAKGYRVTPQWKVGSYRIDLVVSDDNQKVAIECDGERFHSGEEKIRQDMERQTILERLGWRFIRIRGSEYYRDKEETMDDVFTRIHVLGIQPSAIKHQGADPTPLLDSIKQKAAQLIERWHCENKK